MTQHFDFVIDPEDPRAPSQEVWDAMTPDQREATVRSLPVEVPLELMCPEGDRHRIAKNTVVDTLDGFFRRVGRQVYVSSELSVYYPEQPRFAPDVLIVTDVSNHERSRWVVSHEGKGLDLVIEVHVDGSFKKDFERNRAFYASLGIPEYFLLDRTKDRLFGWHLASPTDRVYTPIVPQIGMYESRVLQMSLMLDDGHVRFRYGTATLQAPQEIITLLEGYMQNIEEKKLREAAERIQLEQEKEQAEQERDREHLRAEQEKQRAEQEKLKAEKERARVLALEEELRKLRDEKAK